MNKGKLLLSLFLITLAVALVGGATMAWFTDSASIEPNEFVAGTVAIEAGSTVVRSQNFNPGGGSHFLYGIRNKVDGQDGDLYEIDVLKKQANKIFDMPSGLTTDASSPNALGFDGATRRLYFSATKAGNSELYFYDLVNKQLIKATGDNNQLPGVVFGATFGEGYYWYIRNNSDELYRVSFNSDGTVSGSPFLYDEITDGAKTYAFGDIALDIRDGILYGSTSGQSGTDKEFFKYDIAKKEYNLITDDNSKAVDLQIAFGSDGHLYGHRALNTDSIGRYWFKIDLNDGSRESLGRFTPDYRYQDIASGYISVWNPGDCEKIKYQVRNTGSKNIRVRASYTGEWTFDWAFLWDNWESLGISEILGDDVTKPGENDKSDWSGTPAGQEVNKFIAGSVNIKLCSPGDWEKNAHDGKDYYYYKPDPDKPLPPYDEANPQDHEAELCLEVCLSGAANNLFQAASYELNVTFEAVQSSNDAPYEEWGTPHDIYPAPTE